MRLTLSSAAAPEATLDELVDAAVRRGFAGLELEEGHGHGVAPVSAGAGASARSARQLALEAGVPVVAFRPRRATERALELAAVLEVPALVPLAWARETDPVTPPDGGRILLVTSGAAGETRGLGEVLDRWGTRAGVSWTVDPSSALDDPAAILDRVRAGAGDRLAHVRLAGGGPEAAAQEGQGIGALMARLALARFGGPVVLAPSSPRYRVVWSAWLGRRGGWGCGGKGGDPDLVRLEADGGVA